MTLLVVEPGLDDYDSDTGVMLDPGYAECADAIKGILNSLLSVSLPLSPSLSFFPLLNFNRVFYIK